MSSEENLVRWPGTPEVSSRITMSAQVDKLFEALSAAQGEYKPLVKDKLNPHFKSKYSTLADVLEALKDPFQKYGLVLIQVPMVSAGRVSVVTMIGHKSGQWIEGELSLKPQADTPQGVGSAITYGRRYGASSMAGLEGDDDDGEAAHGRGKPHQQYQQQAQSQPMQVPPNFDKGNPKDFEKLEGYLISVGVEGKNAHWEIATALQGQPFLKDNINQAIKSKGMK